MKYKKDPLLEMLEYYFDTYLPVAKGLSPATVKSYKSTFRLFFEFMFTVKDTDADQIRFKDLTSDIIIEFLDWLENERHCGVTTRNQRLSALTAFAEYAQNRDFGAASDFKNSLSCVPKKKCLRKERSYFTRDEVKILLDLPSSSSEIGMRDKTLLSFMYASGTRAQEVCNITVGDIQFFPDKANIRILGKGQKMRCIGIPNSASSMLKRYIEHKGISEKKERHVFSSQTHEKMTVSCIEEIYAKYIEKARSENPTMFRGHYTPHSMRHTTATHMLEAGVPLIVVKNFLGHESLQTTQIYAEVTPETASRQLKAWNEKWFPKDSTDAGEEWPKTSKDNIPAFLR